MMLKSVSDNLLRNLAAGSIVVGGLSSLFFIGRSNGAVLVILLLSLFVGMAINSLRDTQPTAASNTTVLNLCMAWRRSSTWIAFLFLAWLYYFTTRPMGR